MSWNNVRTKMPKETYRTPEELGTEYYQSKASNFYLRAIALASLGAASAALRESNWFLLAMFTLEGYISIGFVLYKEYFRTVRFDNLKSHVRSIPIPQLPVHWERLGPRARVYYQKDLDNLHKPSI